MWSESDFPLSLLLRPANNLCTPDKPNKYEESLAAAWDLGSYASLGLPVRSRG